LYFSKNNFIKYITAKVKINFRKYKLNSKNVNFVITEKKPMIAITRIA
jgi:hypothetical protein